MGHKPEMTPEKRAEYLRLAKLKATRGEGEAAMNDREAEREAVRRWGADGRAWHNAHARKNDLRYCQVGIAVGSVREEWTVYGYGETWEAAFANATAKGRK